MSKDPITKKARALQHAMTNAFLSDAPSYQWCREQVVESGDDPWQRWPEFEQKAKTRWHNRLDRIASGY